MATISEKKLKGLQIYNRFKDGNLPNGLYGKMQLMGRNGGMNGIYIQNDFDTGEWKTRIYQTSSSDSIPNSRWFHIEEFVREIEARGLMGKIDRKVIVEEHSNIIDVNQNTFFGSPQQNDNQYQCDVFVIMPFAPEYLPIYEDHIKSKVEDMGYSVKRGDDFFSKRSIMSDVWSAIYNSNLIIADCTGRNPNVFYELGIAHTLDKPVIVISQNMEDIPFDIRHLRCIEYKYTPRGVRKFENDLSNAINKILN